MHGERRRAIAVGGEPLHEIARRRLVQRVELQASRRVRDRQLRGRGLLGARRARIALSRDRLAVALLQHPVLVEVGEQRAAVQRRGRLQGTAVDEGVELLEVGAQCSATRSRPATSASAPSGAERPAQRPRRAAQRGPGARVQHVGPEARGEGTAWVLAGMQREPGEQLPRAAARGLLDGAAVDVRLQRAEQPHPEHAAILRRCSVDPPLTVH